LAAVSPSNQLRAEFRIATPFFLARYVDHPVTLTGKRLAAIDAVDTALHDHCSLGRVIFEIGASRLAA
jgi:hypothetical protein